VSMYQDALGAASKLFLLQPSESQNNPHQYIRSVSMWMFFCFRISIQQQLQSHGGMRPQQRWRMSTRAFTGSLAYKGIAKPLPNLCPSVD
jgi:hypothetical protein